MTAQEITNLVSTLGFPIILVGGLLWFFAVKVWPWYVARQEANDLAQAKREESHTAQVAQTREVYERVISVLDRIIVKLDTQHVDVMYELRARRAASAPRTDIHQ